MKIFMRFIIAVISIILIVFIIFFVDRCVRMKREMVMTKQLIRRFTPGTAEHEMYKKGDERSREYYMHVNKAREYLEKNDYDHAIKEYRETLKMNYNQWMTHEALLGVYEKAGHHNLALQEINWLLFCKPSQRVTDELLIRKKKLETSLKDVVKCINIINGVTDKNYILNEMGKPGEILSLKEDKEAWIYKEYMDISKAMPHMTKKQPFVIIFDKDGIAADNYITDDKSLDVLRKELIP